MSRDWKQIAQTEKKLAEHWEAQYAAEKERADRAIQERKQFNQVYEMLLKKFKEAEAREREMIALLKRLAPSAWNGGEQLINNLLASLYPKEEETT